MNKTIIISIFALFSVFLIACSQSVQPAQSNDATETSAVQESMNHNSEETASQTNAKTTVDSETAHQNLIKTAENSQSSSEVKEFKIEANDFKFTPSTIEVNQGDKVRLIITSRDVTHGIAIPEYNINEQLPVGKPVAIEFTADKSGNFDAFCSVVCGPGHRNMKGKIVVK